MVKKFQIHFQSRIKIIIVIDVFNFIFRWEDEYYAAYKAYSGLLHLNEDKHCEKNIVKASSPEKFVSAVTKSADRLLGRKIPLCSKFLII